ncbi:MAG: integral rane efflux protein [Nocardioidaceae bacterium]|nr:integral rane efflux protein [Nocardioidaceae bacterium]
MIVNAPIALIACMGVQHRYPAIAVSMVVMTVGTLIAVLVTTQLPAGVWSNDLVASFFHGERITRDRRASTPQGDSRDPDSDWNISQNRGLAAFVRAVVSSRLRGSRK